MKIKIKSLDSPVLATYANMFTNVFMSLEFAPAMLLAYAFSAVVIMYGALDE